MLARCNGASINSLTESVQSVAENETSEPILYLEWQRKPWLSSCIRRSLWISWSYPFLSGVLPQQTWGLPSGGCWPLREVHAWLCCARIFFVFEMKWIKRSKKKINHWKSRLSYEGGIIFYTNISFQLRLYDLCRTGSQYTRSALCDLHFVLPKLIIANKFATNITYEPI